MSFVFQDIGFWTGGSNSVFVENIIKHLLSVIYMQRIGGNPTCSQVNIYQ